MPTINKFFSRYRVKIKTFGNSMYPLLHDGDIVFIKKPPPLSKIKVNDFICVKKQGRLFTHRVIYKKNNYVITKGDNNALSDGKIRERNIAGAVYAFERNGKLMNIEALYLIQSTLYFDEIMKVKSNFEKNRIDFVFLKGLPIHLHYQESHPRRIYADCDMLIRKNQQQKAVKILRRLGYKKANTYLYNIQKHLKDKDSEISFYKIRNGFPVIFDLHLEAVFLMIQLGKIDQLYPQILINSFTSKLLQEKRYVKINNQKVPILSKENLFIYLLLHLYHHNFGGTYRFDLIVLMIRKEKLDYESVADTIRRFRLDNFIYPCLALLHKHYTLRKASILLRELNPSKHAIKFTQRNLTSINIFDDGDRINSGVKRFRTLFSLSPNNFFKKTLIFLSPKIFFTIFWVSMKKPSALIK